MKKLVILIILLFIGILTLRADDTASSDQDFMQALDNVKNPFLADLPPPPVVVVQKPVVVLPPPKPQEAPKPVVRPVVLPEPEITLPDLKLQGVVVGEEVDSAIINDQTVPLYGTIEGAKLISVTNGGVELLYQGKKFFLKSE